jgi:hypothetical protein
MTKGNGGEKATLSRHQFVTQQANARLTQRNKANAECASGYVFVA